MWRQKDNKFKDILFYIGGLWLIWDIWDSVWKQINNKKRINGYQAFELGKYLRRFYLHLPSALIIGVDHQAQLPTFPWIVLSSFLLATYLRNIHKAQRIVGKCPFSGLLPAAFSLWNRFLLWSPSWPPTSASPELPSHACAPSSGSTSLALLSLCNPSFILHLECSSSLFKSYFAKLLVLHKVYSEEHLHWNIVELLSVWAPVPCNWSAQLDFTGIGLIMYI